MAALSVADCKAYLRIQGTAEDAPLAAWLLQARAAVEAEIGPIDPILRTWVVERPTHTTRLTMLQVPMFPVAVEDSAAETEDLVLTDGDGTELVEGTDYRLDVRTGVITPIDGTGHRSCFSTFPYTIAAYVGIGAPEEYADRIEPVINAAILDVVADRYQRRSPAASSESTGGDVSTQYANEGLPQRVRDMLAPWRVTHLAQ
jgi:uncharacterized phiE125 gp8 family phage protein